MFDIMVDLYLKFYLIKIVEIIIYIGFKYMLNIWFFLIYGYFVIIRLVNFIFNLFCFCVLIQFYLFFIIKVFFWLKNFILDVVDFIVVNYDNV